MAATSAYNWRYPTPTNVPPPTNNPVAGPIENQYKLYNTSVGQQAEDYSGIMNAYKNFIGGAGGVNAANKPIAAPGLVTPTAYTPQTLTPTQASPYSPQQIQALQSYSPTMMGAPRSISPESYTAQQTRYEQSPESQAAISQLGELSRTGGYDAETIAGMRARGVSPIRSVYANAQRDMDRQKSLQGGFSPNFNASRAKMARELSDTLATQTQNVNTGIAERVAQNRLSAAPQFASAAGAQSDLRNRIMQENAGRVDTANRSNAESANSANVFNANNFNRVNEGNVASANQGQLFNIGNQMDVNKFNANAANQGNMFNAGNAMDVNKFNTGSINDANRLNATASMDANKFNISNKMDVDKLNAAMQSGNQSAILDAIKGMSSLYGTTPALSQLFGQQAMGQSQMQNQIDQQNKLAGVNLIGQYMR